MVLGFVIGVSDNMNNAVIESPSRNGNQKVFEIACFDRDGSQTRKFVVSKKTVIKILAIGLAILGLSEIGGDVVGKWAMQEKADSLRPTMEALAKNGQDEASLWLAKNYPETEAYRVAPLADKGMPEAMLYQGFNLARAGDKNGAMLWIEKSADAGNEKAVEIIKRDSKR